MNTAAPFVLGIDVGGTKIAAGVVDPTTGAIVRRETIATGPQRGGVTVVLEQSTARRQFAILLATCRAANAGPERLGLANCAIIGRSGRIVWRACIKYRAR